jgi:hypothetical protein
VSLAKTIFAARPLKAAKVCFTICQNKALTHHMPRHQKSLLVFRHDLRQFDNTDFRIFNPWLRQRKFDVDCAYIKRWLPEPRSFPAAVIHYWHKNPQPGDYSAPIVDHALRSQRTKALFRSRH